MQVSKIEINEIIVQSLCETIANLNHELFMLKVENGVLKDELAKLKEGNEDA
jgi:hypothetical protein